ncbi:MAG TPA: DUF692 family protein [Xanthomonadaceae bacterium]|nr:DUF692 family protein [Xanthomonadaceae bacterium]
MQPLPKLGVGLAFQSPLKHLIEQPGDDLDCVEVVPDILWTDLGPGREPRYVDDPEGVAWLREIAAQRPVIAHGIGLSIGSASHFDRGHVRQLRRWHALLDFPWHSDHLAYHVADLDGTAVNVGITLPLPRDAATLDLLAPRIAEVMATVPVPFLLENNVYYFEIPDAEMDEPDFLNTLCRRCGCGLLLDLHNVYTNAVNHDFDARALVDAIDLSLVGEIHVAGGMTLDGTYLDAHSDTVPDPVWSLLEHVLPRCRNVGAVIFELFGSWFEVVGEARVRADLRRLRRLWETCHRPGPRAVGGRGSVLPA